MIVRRRHSGFGDAVDTSTFSTATPYSSSDPGAGIMFDPTAALETPPVSIDSVLPSIPANSLPGLQTVMNTYVSPWANDSSTTTTTLSAGAWIALGLAGLFLIMLIAKK